jgi:undecaprenyl-diphosphatase
MGIPLGEGAVLGFVLGLTEFLPVSSAAHLALAQLLEGHAPDRAVAAILHAGTLLATIAVLRKRAWSALTEGLRGLGRPALLAETPGGRDAMFVALASLPTLPLALLLRRQAGAALGSLYLLGSGLLLSALVVTLARLAPPGAKATPSWAGALLVGVAQGAAALPGVSRPATTIAALLWLGVGAERAFELSMLASIPVVAGMIAIEGPYALAGGTARAPLALGAVLALAVGAGALAAMRRVVVAGKLAWFSLYLVPVALATLAWGYARP